MILLALSVAQAGVILVDAGGGGDATTIQGGLDLAVAGDTVEVAPGTYPEDIDFEARTVAVESSGGPAVTLLVGTGSGPVVRIDSGEGAGTRFAGFTVQGGDATDHDATGDAGGGMHVSGTPVTVDDVWFVGNAAEFGGGLLLREATGAELLNLRFEGNTARYGGGLYLYESVVTLRGGIFTGNVADDGGGAVFLYGGSTTFRELSAEANATPGSGGGLYADAGAALACTFCTFAGNEAAQGGGARVDGASAHLEATTLVGNVATEAGGGLLTSASSQLDGYHLVLDGNVAPYGAGLYASQTRVDVAFLQAIGNLADGGGGIYLDRGSLELENALFVGNVAATSNGGGVAADNAEVTLVASIFALNEGYSGGAVHLTDGATGTLSNLTVVEGASSASAAGVRVAGGASLALTNSILAYATAGSGISAAADAAVTLGWLDLYANAGGATSGGLADPTGANGNLAVDPMFVAFAQDGAWADDLHLAGGSPLVDAGDPSVLDADGSVSDIGAFGGPRGAEWAAFDGDRDGYDVGADCDDGDPATHPDAWDGCDDLDQDCDGEAREGCDTGDGGDDTGTTPDSGDDGDDDDPTDDTGTPGDAGGCGCATGPATPAGLPLAALLGLALARRRRR